MQLWRACPPSLLSLLLLFPSVDDTHEVSCLQRSAADKATINVRFSEQFRSVACLAAASVKDSGVVSNSLSVFLCNDAADVGVYFLSLVSRGSLACSDGPDRFVSDDYVLELFLCEVENAALKLGLNDLVLLASSLSSRLSPIQKITFRPFFSARSTFSFSISGVSA